MTLSSCGDYHAAVCTVAPGERDYSDCDGSAVINIECDALINSFGSDVCLSSAELKEASAGSDEVSYFCRCHTYKYIVTFKNRL